MKDQSSCLPTLFAAATLLFAGTVTEACAAPRAQDHGHDHQQGSEQIQAPIVSAPGTTPGEDIFQRGESTATSNSFHLRAALGHTAYTRAMPGQIKLKLDFDTEAPVSNELDARPAINLVLLIDRSKSMAQDRKFEHAMEAVGLVIENLTQRDTLSVVAFSDDAVVLSPAGRVVNKAYLRHRLSEVAPAGWTNLSAGLLEAIAQLEPQNGSNARLSSELEQARKKVILLTDGKANRGVTSSAGLENLAAALHRRKIALSTMGVGLEFDGRLLASLAEAGGGRYTYVKDSEGIPKAMERELDGFLSVRAQNAVLMVRVGSGAEIVRVYGHILERPTPEISFKLGDLREGESGTFLFDLAPRSFEMGASVDVEVSLVGDDPASARRSRQVVSLQATYTEVATEVVEGRNRAISLYGDVLGALEDAEEAVLAYDLERATQASAQFDAFYQAAREVALETQDQELLNQTFLLRHFMTELEASRKSGLLHDHDEAASQLGKGVDYRRYLLEHHGDQH